VVQDQGGSSFVRIQQGQARFGFSRSEFDFDEEEILDVITWRNIPGAGWGFDLGLTYEHRPKFADYQYTLNGKERVDQAENKYKYRIGASLLDMGGITYKNTQHVRRYNLTRQNLDFTEDTFGDVDLENLAPTLEEALAVEPSERLTSLHTGLPTTLHLNVDYRLSRRLFLNASMLQNLRGKAALSMRQFSVLTIAPRFENEFLELAFPVSIYNNYRDLALGAMLRMGPLLIGSNNLGGILGVGKITGADVYVGVGFGIGTGGQREKLEKKEEKKAKRAAKATAPK
jgi:hypothetical protein